MTWRTHVAIGTNAVWLMVFLPGNIRDILVYLPVAAIAGILPDIDASGAKIHFIGGGVLGIFKGAFYGKYFHHRGLMHSILASVVFFILLWAVFQNSYPLLAPIFAVSYFSHSVIDGFNTGVGYLYPFITKKFALLPKPLRSKVGGVMDVFLLFLGLAGLLLFLAAFSQQLRLSRNI